MSYPSPLTPHTTTTPLFNNNPTNTTKKQNVTQQNLQRIRKELSTNLKAIPAKHIIEIIFALQDNQDSQIIANFKSNHPEFIEIITNLVNHNPGNFTAETYPSGLIQLIAVVYIHHNGENSFDTAGKFELLNFKGWLNQLAGKYTPKLNLSIDIEQTDTATQLHDTLMQCYMPQYIEKYIKQINHQDFTQLNSNPTSESVFPANTDYNSYGDFEPSGSDKTPPYNIPAFLQENYRFTTTTTGSGTSDGQQFYTCTTPTKSATTSSSATTSEINTGFEKLGLNTPPPTSQRQITSTTTAPSSSHTFANLYQGITRAKGLQKAISQDKRLTSLQQKALQNFINQNRDVAQVADLINVCQRLIDASNNLTISTITIMESVRLPLDMLNLIPHITELDLGGKFIFKAGTNRSAVPFCELKYITQLSLFTNPANQEFKSLNTSTTLPLDLLTGCKKITELKIGIFGALKTQALPKSPYLTSLSVVITPGSYRQNKLGTTNPKDPRKNTLPGIFDDFTSLTELSLTRCDLEELTIKDSGKFPPKLEKLTLVDTGIVSLEPRVLQCMRNLKELTIDGYWGNKIFQSYPKDNFGIFSNCLNLHKITVKNFIEERLYTRIKSLLELASNATSSLNQAEPNVIQYLANLEQNILDLISLFNISVDSAENLEIYTTSLDQILKDIFLYNNPPIANSIEKTNAHRLERNIMIAKLTEQTNAYRLERKNMILDLIKNRILQPIGNVKENNFETVSLSKLIFDNQGLIIRELIKSRKDNPDFADFLKARNTPELMNMLIKKLSTSDELIQIFVLNTLYPDSSWYANQHIKIYNPEEIWVGQYMHQLIYQHNFNTAQNLGALINFINFRTSQGLPIEVDSPYITTNEDGATRQIPPLPSPNQQLQQIIHI